MSEEARDVRLEDPEADARMVSATSLWYYLPDILLYPLRGYAPGVVVVIGFLFWLFNLAGIFAIAMAPIVLGWLTVYLMMIVEDTALGHAIAPPFGTEMLGHSDYGRLLLVAGFWFGIIALGIWLERGGVAHGTHFAMLGGMLVFPAFLVGLALEVNTLSALNPLRLLRFMYLTGGSYLFAVSVLGIAYIALAMLSNAVASFLADMIFIYFLVMCAHLMGFIAYHRHERLGIEVVVTRPTEEHVSMEMQQRSLQSVLQRACALNDAGNWDAARHLLRQEQPDVVDPRLYHEELYEALRIHRQKDLSLVEGKQLVRCLVMQKRLDRALDICEQCLDVNRQFEPEPLADSATLAEAALNARRIALFEKFINDIPPRHPNTREAAALQFLHARWLTEHRKQDAEALVLLKPLLTDTGHPWYPRIRALHQALERLGK